MVDEALDMQREIYRVQLRLEGRFSEITLDAALYLSKLLMEQHHYHEAKKLLHGVLADAKTQLFIDEASVSTNDTMARLAQINLKFAICLWKFHFYGYDNYRDDLRTSIMMLEEMKNMVDTIRPLHVDDALRLVRDNQLDWCIHDLTQVTFEAYRGVS